VQQPGESALGRRHERTSQVQYYIRAIYIPIVTISAIYTSIVELMGLKNLTNPHWGAAMNAHHRTVL
jgi:hypothetical protein